MSKSDFQRLDVLFNEAITLPQAQWEAFISEHCRCDNSLAVQLRAMLNADLSTRDPLVAAVVADPEPEIPATIGAYTIERLLGRGGMGLVYLGRRQIGNIEQNLAIKLLKSTQIPQVLRQRFDQERALLARLSHPNIAALIDAGETDQGTPFVAMEYIDGLSLTAFAESHHLDLKERLDIFSQLCHAVAYAHRNLIVHRDLKPDNVLVNADGHVKLLDFGIAKLLPADGEASRGTLTRAGAMTPIYAAPEQVLGEPITTQCDIYSLGVVLYELLAGQLPYNVTADTSALELERQICHTQPQPPSASTQASLPRKRLRGDLDKIILKALRKEPQRRYDSVAMLLDDLDRFQRGLPVSARADSLQYRLGRLLARNPWGSALAALLVLTLAAFAVTSSWHATQLATERDRARQEADVANEVAEFMVGLFQVSDPRESANNSLSARELLDRAALSIDQEIDAAPALRARLMHVIGLSYSNIGDYDRGMEMLEAALKIREQQFGLNSLEVSDSLNRMGNFHRMYGRLDLAEPALERALEIRRKLDLGPSDDLADAHNNFGLFQYELGHNQRAIALLDQAIDLHQRSAEPNRASIAVSMHNRTLALNRLARYQDAQQTIEQALDIKLELGLGKRSTYANSLAVLATTEQLRGDFQAAWKHRTESLSIRRKVYPEAHPNLVSGLTGFADLAIDLGDADQAGPWLEEALSIALETGGEGSLLEARVQMVAGHLALELGNPESAKNAFSKAVAIRSERMQPDNPSLWVAQQGLAESLFLSGELKQARRIAQNILAARSSHFEINHPLVLESSVLAAAIALATGNTAEALRLCEGLIANASAESSYSRDRHRVRAHRLMAKLDPDNKQYHQQAAREILLSYFPKKHRRLAE